MINELSTDHDRRVACPVCGTAVPLTPKRRQLQSHRDPRSDSTCSGSGTRPAKDVERNRARRLIESLLNKMTFLVCTVLAGVVGILSWVGISPPWSTDDPSGAGGSAGREPAAPDPYMFVEFNSVTPQRQQECAGLIGLCIGQPVELAFAALGNSQADGFPQNVTPSEHQVDTRCSRWRPERLTSIDVCDRHGSISKISLTFSGEPPASLAMPLEFVLRPDTLPGVAERLTSEFGAEPFHSFYVPGEGEFIGSFSWFLPQDVEGPPEVRVSVNGRSVDPGSGPEPTPCDDAQVQFPYVDVLQAADQIRLEDVEVSLVSDDDLAMTTCP